MDPQLEDFLHACLDTPRVVDDLTWDDGVRPLVLKVIDRAGRTWIAKRHLLSDKYRAEVTAYERWTSGLRGRVPEVHAYDDELQTLVITAVPGAPPDDWTVTDLVRQAGEFLAALHDGEAFAPYDAVVSDRLTELDRVMPQARELLGERIVDLARSQLEDLTDAPAPRRVPCHQDFSPRNWLVDAGRLYVIDFGDAGPDAWVNDFGRLFLGWRIPPDAKEHLLRGYGRVPTEDDLVLLRACYTATLVSGVVFAREHGYVGAEAGCRQVLRNVL